MSDNIKAQEMRRRLIIFLRIPTEVWTDVLKMLSRRILVQRIAPVCYRLKEISNKNVKSIHVIENANQFTDKLEDGSDLDAKMQLWYIAVNKCPLASQFRLIVTDINEKNQAILRHCPDLIDGCHISWHFKEKKNKHSTSFLECLSLLEKTKSIAIIIFQDVDQVDDFWQHPTFQYCSRAHLLFRDNLSATTMTTAFENIFNWLHLQPTVMDYAGADRQVRCMITYLSGHKPIDWLIDRCSQNLRYSAGPADRHPYVFSFSFCNLNSDWPSFGQFRRIENQSTGEVLVLDRMFEGDRVNNLSTATLFGRRRSQWTGVLHRNVQTNQWIWI